MSRKQAFSVSHPRAAWSEPSLSEFVSGWDSIQDYFESGTPPPQPARCLQSLLQTLRLDDVGEPDCSIEPTPRSHCTDVACLACGGRIHAGSCASRTRGGTHRESSVVVIDGHVQRFGEVEFGANPLPEPTAEQRAGIDRALAEARFRH